jgi:hypothetical protein
MTKRILARLTAMLGSGFFAISISAAITIPARAQDAAAMDMTGMGIYAMEEAVMEAAGAKKSGKKRPAVKSVPKSIKLTYRPSLERRRANLAHYLQQAKVKDPTAAADLETLFAQGDIIERLGSAIAPYGLRHDNVADAYALWWVNLWRAANKKSADPTRAQLQGVKAQAARALASAPVFAKANDATKQQIAELLLIHTALNDAAIDQAKSNPAKQQALADLAKREAQAGGLTVDSLTLTAKGFAAK